MKQDAEPSEGGDNKKDLLINYGCWCQLRGDTPRGKVKFSLQTNQSVIKGQGEPVDALDAACKEWHQCRACTKIDDRSCNPNDAPFYTFDYSNFSGAGNDLCGKNEGCALHNCQCDQQLGFMLGYFYVSQIKMQYVTNVDGSGFDYKNQCKTSSSADGAGVDENNNVIGTPTGLSEWGFECCGTYPNRVPFKTNQNTCCPGLFWYELVSLGSCQTIDY